MIRSLACRLKPLFCALLALVALVCALEVSLRVQDSYSGQLTMGPVGLPSFMDTSWSRHHLIKPMQQFESTDPDTGERIPVAINSLGLRGAEVRIPKPPGVYRILCLGDESTFAAGIAEDQSFCNQLEQFLSEQSRLEVEVLNAGTPGYCPLLSYLQLKHALLSTRPDLVVLNFDMSDVADDHHFRRHTQTQADSIPLSCPNPALTKRRLTGQSLVDRFLILRWARRQLGNLPAESPPSDRRDIDSPTGRFAWLRDQPPDWSVYIRHALSPLDDLRRLCEDQHCRFVVATSPKPWQISPTACNKNSVRARIGIPHDVQFKSTVPFETVDEYARSINIVHIRTDSAFRHAEEPDRLFFENAPRFSAEGHELFARVLGEQLIEQVPGPWMRGPRYDPQSRPDQWSSIAPSQPQQPAAAGSEPRSFGIGQQRRPTQSAILRTRRGNSAVQQ